VPCDGEGVSGVGLGVLRNGFGETSMANVTPLTIVSQVNSYSPEKTIAKRKKEKRRETDRTNSIRNNVDFKVRHLGHKVSGRRRQFELDVYCML
jgi:hypothetical protein